MDVTLWHNPRCSKSRQALELLREHGIEPKVVQYLSEPPAASQIEDVLSALGIEPRELMRKQEAPIKSWGSPTRARPAAISYGRWRTIRSSSRGRSRSADRAP
jgi:arsenate reductase